MIQFRKSPSDRICELGGGMNRHPDSTINIDCREGPGVDIVIDFENVDNWPLKDDEWDAVLCIFCLEHISYLKTKNFLKETLRILKPGKKCIFVLPNTEVQMQTILAKTEWDGDESCFLFGQQNYSSNAHKSAWSPKWATRIFQGCGFIDIQVSPYGTPELKSDMIVVATKPLQNLPSSTVFQSKEGQPSSQPIQTPINADNGQKMVLTPVIPQVPLTPKERAKLYGRTYFDPYQGTKCFYFDYPTNEAIVRQVLDLRPKSVLELGCARGYVLKKLEDAGVEVAGIDISKHAWLTRACENIFLHDICEAGWDIALKNQNSINPDLDFDLCLSVGLLEHIPEEHLEFVLDYMTNFSKRGLHATTFQDDGQDPTRCTIRSKEWWQSKLPKNHQVVSIGDIQQGGVPLNVMRGDGKLKLNIGCAYTMFFYGWMNIDAIEATPFAQQLGYNFQRLDVRNGLPYSTGTVDMIYMGHFFEHLSYEDGQRFLKECRRVIKPDGVIRILVPDGWKLMKSYAECSPSREVADNWPGLWDFDEVNENCSKSHNAIGKVYSLLCENHLALYDEKTLRSQLEEAGFNFENVGFRRGNKQMLIETLDTHPELSLIAQVTPKIE